MSTRIKSTPSSTIAASERRVIKNEMTALGRNYKKLLAAALKDHKLAGKELRAAERKFVLTSRRIDKSVARASKNIGRRMAILEGRL